MVLSLTLAAVKFNCDSLTKKGKRSCCRSVREIFLLSSPDIAIVSGQALHWANQHRIIAVVSLLWSDGGSVCGRVFFKQKG